MFPVLYLCIFLYLVTGIVGDPLVSAPYNPSYIWVPSPENSSTVYVLSPRSSASQGLQLQSLDLSVAWDVDAPPLQDLASAAPPLAGDSEAAVIPIAEKDGLPVLYAGDCQSQDRKVWKFVPEADGQGQEGEWIKSSVDQAGDGADTPLQGPNFLASAVAFSQSAQGPPSDLFLFGGMCPADTGTEKQDWVSTAEYSRDMLLLTPDGSTSHTSYELTAVSMRLPPVAEAGFSMTPLLPAHTNSSADTQSIQQSFVLIGGHTQQAFINTSQIALFSLPETSWSYIPVDQPSAASAGSRLARREITGVEPRSGHTAVLSPDGSSIIVFGGWVGETRVAAEPQLAVLRLGEGYGGSGAWSWDAPEESPHGLPKDSGIFGHGAAMLPGGIMIVAGGYEISDRSSTESGAPRPNTQMYLFNTTSESWITSYDPSSQSEASSKQDNSGPLSSASQKAGLGVGVGVGVSALAAVAIFLFCYRTRHTRQHRKFREQELRKLALGAERPHFHINDPHAYQPMTQANTEKSPFASPSARGARSDVQDAGNTESAEAERTGLLVEVPSPTKGSHNSGLSRGHRSSALTGGSRGFNKIHPIDECDEYEEVPQDEAEPYDDHRYGKGFTGFDPFVEPPSPVKASLAPPILPELPLLHDSDADGYNWLDGVAPGLTSRSASPDKSNRTLSDLSESSGSGISISSRRSNPTSLNPAVLQMSAFRSRHDNYSPLSHTTAYKPGFDTIADRSSASDRLLDSDNSPTRYHGGGGSLMGQGPAWLTNPELSSPNKSPLGPKNKALKWAGNSVRRAIGSIRKADVSTQPHSGEFVGNINNHNHHERSDTSSPTHKSLHSVLEENAGPPSDSGSSSRILPRRAVSTSSSVLRQKQGARDWDAVSKRGSAESSTLLRIRTLAGSPSYAASRGTDSPDFIGGEGGFDEYGDSGKQEGGEDEDEDWDVEAAAEGRVVQVTFTVPKEKLRVVNGGVGDGSDDDDDDDGNNDEHGAMKGTDTVR